MGDSFPKPLLGSLTPDPIVINKYPPQVFKKPAGDFLCMVLPESMEQKTHTPFPEIFRSMDAGTARARAP